MPAQATTFMERKRTLELGSPARDRASRRTPTTAISSRKVFWKARYSEIRLPNMSSSLAPWPARSSRAFI
jgi:hypothetical protein